MTLTIHQREEPSLNSLETVRSVPRKVHRSGSGENRRNWQYVCNVPEGFGLTLRFPFPEIFSLANIGSTR